MLPPVHWRWEIIANLPNLGKEMNVTFATLKVDTRDIRVPAPMMKKRKRKIKNKMVH